MYILFLFILIISPPACPIRHSHGPCRRHFIRFSGTHATGMNPGVTIWAAPLALSDSSVNCIMQVQNLIQKYFQDQQSLFDQVLVVVIK